MPLESLFSGNLRCSLSLVRYTPEQALSVVSRMQKRGIKLTHVCYHEGGHKHDMTLPNVRIYWIPHALFFDNGAEWDEINGWRDKVNYRNGIKRRAAQ